MQRHRAVPGFAAQFCPGAAQTVQRCTFNRGSKDSNDPHVVLIIKLKIRYYKII
jgi:hypothetical protein